MFKGKKTRTPQEESLLQVHNCRESSGRQRWEELEGRGSFSWGTQDTENARQAEDKQPLSWEHSTSPLGRRLEGLGVASEGTARDTGPCHLWEATKSGHFMVYSKPFLLGGENPNLPHTCQPQQGSAELTSRRSSCSKQNLRPHHTSTEHHWFHCSPTTKPAAEPPPTQNIAGSSLLTSLRCGGPPSAPPLCYREGLSPTLLLLPC